MLARLARTMRRDENGVALVMVIGIGSVLALLVIAAVAIALGSARSSRNDQDWNGALAAAYAGVEEYQSRLAADPSYLNYGNPASLFTPDTGSVLPTGALANPALGVGAAGTWAAVPGSDGTASYRYEVDTAAFGTTGSVKLRSTGRVGTETRTVVATMRINSFLDYLYFTDFEVEDPAQYSSTPLPDCARYAYASRPSSCHEIAFGEGDVLTGAVHSNDTIRSCGAVFKGAVTTGFAPASGPRYSEMTSTGGGCSRLTDFQSAGSPAAAPLVVMPATNAALKLETRTDITVTPGCLYTGPTTIRFLGDGQVTVRSPWTKATRVLGNPASSGTADAVCGIPGTGAGQLASAGGATFTVPPNNVMYVQDVPAAPTTDPNYTAPGTTPKVTDTGARLECTGASGQANGNGIGYPMAGEDAPSSASYSCRAGDAFVQGTLQGSVTVATSRFIYVTANIRYASASRDMLGLVGDGAVLVWNPVDKYNNSVLPSATATNRRIDAAILSVQHTFQVQNPSNGGARGTLTINGAIAQKFRGIVRSGTDGYAKDYNYDARFATRTPPKFLMPVSTTYDVTLMAEVDAAFTATGLNR